MGSKTIEHRVADIVFDTIQDASADFTLVMEIVYQKVIDRGIEVRKDITRSRIARVEPDWTDEEVDYWLEQKSRVERQFQNV